MKFLSLTSFFRISILAFATLFSAGSLHSAETVNTTVDRNNNTVRTQREDNTDWGWIGLFGLLGLAGLLPKNRRNDYDRKDKDTNNRTTNR